MSSRSISTVFFLVVCLIVSGQFVFAADMKRVPLQKCAPLTTDYTFMWWMHGWKGTGFDVWWEKRDGKSSKGTDRRVIPEGKPAVLGFQTGEYGLAIDVASVQVRNFGPINGALPYEEAVAQGNDVVFNLPPASLDLQINTPDAAYHCVRSGDGTKSERDFPWRLIESGRFLQRHEIVGLVFEDQEGGRIEVDARLEIAAWPGRLSMVFEVTPRDDIGASTLGMTFEGTDGTRQVTARHGGTKGEKRSINLVVWGDAPAEDAVGSSESSGIEVLAENAVDDEKLKVVFHPAHGWFYVEVPDEQWSPSMDLDHLKRTRIKIRNTDHRARTVRLFFAQEGNVEGVTGLTPMWRDERGHPVGIPVQISKNWHQTEGHTFLHQGGWFHGPSVLHLPPRSVVTGEMAIAYARWGGVPAVSHAQLCLVGWGTHQLWDEMAIGSWGESICYDPDVNLTRGMIDDIRPLMVTNMGTSDGKWGWTNNVGGGDFLVYFDSTNVRHYLARMKTAYLRHGPNLSSVVYAGMTADGRIEARMEVSSPRADDIVRAYHRLRYDVIEHTPFTRLAFYQLGADRYNDNLFGKIAYGNEDGVADEWQPELGGGTYGRQGIALTGRAPWVSLHESVNLDKETGATGNRGVIVRSWKARLGGRDIPSPSLSVFRTDDVLPSALVEIAPPPGLTVLKPGDFVEAEVELVILPVSAADYYGPNASLRTSLEKTGDTWQPIHRQARGNDLQALCKKGKLVRRYPIVVEVAQDQSAVLNVLGGVGYVPVTFTGLRQYAGQKLLLTIDKKTTEIDQSVHGKDYWQTDYDPVRRTWSVTYNVPLDSPGDQPRTVQLTLTR